METLITGDTLDTATALLKAVTHPVRLQIVNVLINGEFHVRELANTIGINNSIISLQLRILKFAGVVKSRRGGNKVYYTLANNSVERIMKSIITEL